MKCPLKPGLRCEASEDLQRSTPCPNCSVGRRASERRHRKFVELSEAEQMIILEERIRQYFPLEAI